MGPVSNQSWCVRAPGRSSTRRLRQRHTPHHTFGTVQLSVPAPAEQTPEKQTKRVCNCSTLCGSYNRHLLVTVMIHFRSNSCDYSMYNELLWEQVDREVDHTTDTCWSRLWSTFDHSHVTATCTSCHGNRRTVMWIAQQTLAGHGYDPLLTVMWLQHVHWVAMGMDWPWRGLYNRSTLVKVMIHFKAQSCDYNMYTELLWEQTDCDVTVKLLNVLCRFQPCSILIQFWSDKSCTYTHTHTHTHTLSLTHTHTQTHTYTLTHTLKSLQHPPNQIYALTHNHTHNPTHHHPTHTLYIPSQEGCWVC